MSAQLTNFLIHWLVMSLSLWVASHVFKGISFSSRSALLVSALSLASLTIPFAHGKTLIPSLFAIASGIGISTILGRDLYLGLRKF